MSVQEAFSTWYDGLSPENKTALRTFLERWLKTPSLVVPLTVPSPSPLPDVAQSFLNWNNQLPTNDGEALRHFLEIWLHPSPANLANLHVLTFGGAHAGPAPQEKTYAVVCPHCNNQLEIKF